MDFLNKAFAQLGDLFRSMTPAARITSGLLLAVILVSIGYLFTSQVSGGGNYLLGGQVFMPEEITTMSGAFGNANLGDFTVEGNRIRIPNGQQAAYLKALFDNHALPTNYAEHMLNAVTGTSPWANKAQQEEVARIAREAGVSKLLSEQPNVASAQVVFSSRKKGGLRREVIQSALVTVKLKNNESLDKRQIRSFQRAVAAAYAGMRPDQVAVQDTSTGMTYGGDDNSMPADALDDPYMNRMQEYQVAYSNTVTDALRYIQGLTVSCNVELAKELRRQSSEVVVDPKTVAMSTLDQSSESINEQPAPQGRPGVAAQGGFPNGGAALGATGGGKSTETTATTETSNVASHEQTQTEYAGLTPTRVSVSIGVPTTYFENIWRQRNPTPEGEEPPPIDQAAVDQIQTDEIAKIRATVVNLLPTPPNPGIDPESLVNVSAFTPSPVTMPDEPSLAADAMSWMTANWSSLGMIGVGLVSLLMLRSMIKSGPALPDTFLAPIEVPQPEPEEEGLAAAKKKKRFATPPSMRDDLAEMVREDPDTAANILRGWIGNTT